MQKVLHISKYYYPFIGGIEQATRDMVDVLKDNYEQKIICFNHEKGNKVDSVDGVEVRRVKCQCKVASQSISLGYKKALKKIMKEFSPDVVIFHYPNPFVAHYLMKYLKHKSFKLVLYWHLDIYKQKLLSKLFKKQNKKLIKYADKIICGTQRYANGSPWLNQCMDKVEIIPYRVDTTKFEPKEIDMPKIQKIKDTYKDKIICFAFGRHVPYKGIGCLVEASKYLDDKYVILIGGSGELTESLKKQSANDYKVIFLGRLSDDDLRAYINACDIFCFPSITKNESFGIGLAEGLSCGKPAVTFTIAGSGVNYVSMANETGLEVENSNIKAYAEAIKILGENEKLRNNYSIAAKQRVKDCFSMEVHKDLMLCLIGDLVKEDNNK